MFPSPSLSLLKELSFGGDLKLKNRIALAPLTRGRCGRSQVPNDACATYYAQRASSGLIISEATTISKQAMGWAGSAAIYTKEQVEGWKKVNEKVHAAGGVIFCQFWHTGRVASKCFHGLQPVSSSAIAAEGQVTDYDLSKVPYEVPRALETNEVADVVAEYRTAAKNAKEAGFDGIEIHAANGYLLDQFLQSSINNRTDRYGGSFENRFRIVAEVFEAVKESFPSNRIAVRLSPNGVFNSSGSADNFEAFTYYISQLNKFNLAYLHVMDGLGFGFHGLCKQVKLFDVRKVYDGIIMGNCGYEKLTAEGAINTGAVDMIAFGRAYITNPDLPARFENNWPLEKDATEHVWVYPNFPEGDPSIGYTDYPTYEATPNDA